MRCMVECRPTWVLIGVLSGAVHAQGVDALSDQARRERERQEQFRELLQPSPSIQLQRNPTPRVGRLPEELPCVRVNAIVIEGQEPLAVREDELPLWLAGPGEDPIGRCIGARGIDLLGTRLQNGLIGRGYVTSRVLVPTQQVAQGVLTFTVLPGRIAGIRGDFPRAGAIPPLRPGDVLNLRDIEQALEALQRVPTARADIQIEPASDASLGPGYSDLVVNWSQQKSWRTTFTLDDSGSRGTGKLQASATLSLDNALGLNDLFYATLGQSAGWADAGPRGNRALTLHYSAPVADWLLAATTTHGHYHQAVTGANQTYTYSGRSSAVEVKATGLLHRDSISRTNAYLAAFARTSSSDIDDTEIAIQHRRVGGWEAGMSHRRSVGDASADATLAYRRGTGAFGSVPAPEETTGEGSSRFGLLAADASITQPWKWAQQRGQASVQWRAQWNRTPLAPQERFSLGSRFTVRGFTGEQVLLAERGWLLRSELSAEWLGDALSAFVGADHGRVGGASTAQLAGNHLAGAVLGLRGSHLGLRWEVFAATPLSKPARFQAPHAVGGFSVVYSY